MLKKIKSIFFLRKVFNYLDEKRKLNVIKYNKNLQNLINVNIINYKTLSKKIIIKEICEGKEKWKIYNAINNSLLFEGEYLKGIGKEYKDDGKLLYDGEYLNGKRNGKGKTYDDNGKLIYEGEYLNGKQNGKGKVYYSDGKLMLEGEFLNGKKWNIKEYDKNGEIIHELKNGNGYMNSYNFFDIKIFEGEYINGFKNGKGKEYYESGSIKFQGEFFYNLRNGDGKEFYENGKILSEGEYLFGKKWNVKEYNEKGIL